MPTDRLRTIVRRALVATATLSVVVLAVVIVQAAAWWRAESATFDPAPVDAVSLSDAATVEEERTADLERQLAGVAGQVSDLQAALVAANGSIDTDAAGAQATRERLAKATVKLRTLQAQLKAAQARLSELNRAAARQAELNRSVGTASRPAAAERDGEEEQDGD
jgi:chromosome segregation ATPase